MSQKATYLTAATISCPVSCPWHMFISLHSFSLKTLFKTTSLSCIALISSPTPIKLFMLVAGRDVKAKNWTAPFYLCCWTPAITRCWMKGKLLPMSGIVQHEHIPSLRHLSFNITKAYEVNKFSIISHGY